MNMIKSLFFCSITILCLLLLPQNFAIATDIKLPKPMLNGKISVENSMLKKKSARHFSTAPLTVEQVSQLLWAANGTLPVDAVSGATIKTLPSAGGIYPLEIFLLTGSGTVKGLPAGVFSYNSTSNSLVSISPQDSRLSVAQAALSQLWLAAAPAVIIISAAFNKTTAKYGTRGIQYVYMESGAAVQNLYLQSESLGLKIGVAGAFDETQVSTAMKMPAAVTPLLICAIGK